MTCAPAPVTAGRVERFYALLCRFGVDRLLDEAFAPAPTPEGAPLGLDGQALSGTSEVPAPAAPAVRFDVGRLFREAAKEGGLAELADIVLLCDDPSEAPVAAIREALGPFAEASAALLGSLMSFGSGTV